jgi:anti-anti-sigma factor
MVVGPALIGHGTGTDAAGPSVQAGPEVSVGPVVQAGPAGPAGSAYSPDFVDEGGSAAGTPDDLIHLSCEVWPDGGVTVAIRGDLDLATADRMASYVTDVIDRHDEPISVDLSGLGFCDACGLGALIRITAYAEVAGRRFELTHPSRAITRIMRLTGVDEWLLGAGLREPVAPRPVYR